MRWTQLMGIIGLLSLLMGCSAATDTAPPSSPQLETPASTAQATPMPHQATPTFPPTPIVQEIHPLSIAMLRNRNYEGSDFVIEQPLRPGSNYDQAIVSYQSDGLKIYALLTIPQTPKPPEGYPVIIFNHGYIPPAQYRTTERYEAYVDAFARAGYMVVKSDYRGHGFSEGQPESAYRSPGYVIDVMNALASARRHPDADPARVGMWGHSMGGYITLRAMVVDPNIRAGVIWAGVVISYEDLLTRWFRRQSTWRDEMTTTYGSPTENPDFWASLSANSYLTDLTAPIQIHHGTGDSTVPYDFSVILDAEIRAAGKTSELILYGGDDHNIARNRDPALTTSVVFFDQFLKN